VLSRVHTGKFLAQIYCARKLAGVQKTGTKTGAKNWQE